MHSTITQSTLFADRDANHILSKIPQELRQYLTVAESPRATHQLSDQERDRRVRLLLRRFTNQIQYGCTNPYCNVPTCLTYRKRIAPGPLRPHTDLTARALAVKCLEQYATHGRDLGRYPDHKKGKINKTISPEIDGLCWSEPIVPWYIDPNDFFARKHAAVSPKSTSQGRRSTNPARNNTITTPLVDGANNDHTDDVVVDNGDLDRQSSTAKLDHAVSRMREQPDTPTAQHESSDLQISGLAIHSNGCAPQPDRVQTRMPTAKHDRASFAQSLFKHPELQSLDVLPTESAAIEEVTTVPVHSRHPPGTISKKLASPIMSMPPSYPIYPSQPVNTFRILPPSVIDWFRDAFRETSGSDRPARQRLRSFLDQCLYFVLADPNRLLLSASTWNDIDSEIVIEKRAKDVHNLQTTLPKFRHVVEVSSVLAQCYPDFRERFQIAPFLMRALRHCYRLPGYIRRPAESAESVQKHLILLSNRDVARLLLLVLNMIASIEWMNDPAPQSYDTIPSLSSNAADNQESMPISGTDGLVKLSWFVEDGLKRTTATLTAFYIYQADVLPLCESIADIIGHRIAVDGATNTILTKPMETRQSIMKEIVGLLQANSDYRQKNALSNRATQLLDYMQAIVHEKWDRKPIVRRSSPVGGALETLKGLFVQRRNLGLSETWFTILSISTALDDIEMPFEWLSFKPDAKKMHILQFSFLFPSMVVVRYFRSLNLKIMKQSHEKAMFIYANGKGQLLYNPWHVSNLEEVLDATRPHMARYFVMTISRSNIVEDAIGQIWQREKQELLRPLKIILGKDEGENGLDHGGVQQEFFRLAFAESFNPTYGMFDTDSTTHMTWFKPGSLEPVYKYEALGVLMSLAIYNGVTIPINMPLAFYRKILDLKVKKVEHIEDGWPELAKSLQQLLEWEDGDVEDIMALTYDFSYEAFGKTVTIDMARGIPHLQKPINGHRTSKGKSRETYENHKDQGNMNIPHKTASFDIPDYSNGSESEESMSDATPPTPVPVTNLNRDRFVRSYITYLTHKTIEHQFEAFLHGLHALLSPTALSLFTPSHLKLLFEGQPASEPLSISAWRTHTKYEDFTIDDPIIIWFWEILEHDMTQVQLRKLLEFVTASNRLPVGGWEGITFIVQRNGTGDERLPGSSTCYGRLLLPEYTSKEALRERLIKAVEEGFGFGMI